MTPEEAREKLPKTIEVKIKETDRGHVVLTPVDTDVCSLVSVTDRHNGNHYVYIQDIVEVVMFMSDYPQAVENNSIKNNAIIKIESSEFCRLIGGE